MLQGLTGQETPDCVQLLILTQLHRCVLDEDLVDLVIKRGLVSPVVARLEAELAVAKEVSRWTVTLAESKQGLASLTSPDMTGQMVGLSEVSSVLQMRVLDLIVKIAQISEDHLQVAPPSSLSTDPTMCPFLRQWRGLASWPRYQTSSLATTSSSSSTAWSC